MLILTNSCSLNTNLEIKNKIVKEGKFSLLAKEKMYFGLLKIEKLNNRFLLKINSFNGNENFKIKFSEKKTFLERKELLFFKTIKGFKLKDLNFFEYLSWVFEPCNYESCLKLKRDNLSFKKIIKRGGILVETRNDEETFSFKIFLK